MIDDEQLVQVILHQPTQRERIEMLFSLIQYELGTIPGILLKHLHQAVENRQYVRSFYLVELFLDAHKPYIQITDSSPYPFGESPSARLSFLAYGSDFESLFKAQERAVLDVLQIAKQLASGDNRFFAKQFLRRAILSVNKGFLDDRTEWMMVALLKCLGVFHYEDKEWNSSIKFLRAAYNLFLQTGISNSSRACDYNALVDRME